MPCDARVTGLEQETLKLLHMMSKSALLTTFKVQEQANVKGRHPPKLLEEHKLERNSTFM